MLGSGLAVLWFSAPAFAQEPSAVEPANTLVYDQAFFARFEPDNAEDILLRIPGVPAILDTNNQRRGERGFGSGGAQVLLNGRRFPGKTNEIKAALRRIPASNVARVELISGASSDINVQSQGLVVNVVMRPGASIGGSGSWELNGRFNERGRSSIDGLVSYNGAAGALSYGLGIERLTWSPPQFGMARWTYRTRDEIYWYPNGSVQELRPQVWRRSYEKWIFTGNLTYDFPSGAQTNLNGFYETRDVIETGVTRLTRFSLTGLETLRATELQAREQDGVDVLEVSGEHVSALGPGNFTGLFIVRRQGNRTVDFRNLDLSTHITEVSRSDSNVDIGEDIVRVSYVLPLGVGRSVEMGTEGARNTLKQKLLIFADQNEDGVLDRVGSNAAILEPKVKELRGEVFGVFKWQATKSLSLETSLNYEYSKLTTNYPSQPERKPSFLKPRLDARFKVTTRDQIRVLIQRTVSQLNFNTFVPRYNMADDVVESGNPSLEPEKAWTFEVGYERRLPRDGGLIDVRAFYEDITDAIDRHPFCRIGARLEPVSVCLAGAPPLGPGWIRPLATSPKLPATASRRRRAFASASWGTRELCYRCEGYASGQTSRTRSSVASAAAP